MNKNKRMVGIGPNVVDLIPAPDFTKIKQDTSALWDVIGPTVEANINNLPVWKLCVICYAQGLENGYMAEKEVSREQRKSRAD